MRAVIEFVQTLLRNGEEYLTEGVGLFWDWFTEFGWQDFAKDPIGFIFSQAGKIGLLLLVTLGLVKVLRAALGRAEGASVSPFADGTPATEDSTIRDL